MTLRQQEIITTYKEVKSYVEAGKLLGLTKQRIEQVVKKYEEEDSEVHRIKNRFDHSREYCNQCYRSFKIVAFSGKGVCRSCYSYNLSHKKKPSTAIRRTRNMFLPRNCAKCGQAFGHYKNWRTKRMGLICGKCYSQTPSYKAAQKKSFDKYKHTDKYKDYHRQYFKKWLDNPGNREKMNERSALYYWTHRSRLLEGNRQYIRNNRAKIKARRRANYLKKKLLNSLPQPKSDSAA